MLQQGLCVEGSQHPVFLKMQEQASRAEISAGPDNQKVTHFYDNCESAFAHFLVNLATQAKSFFYADSALYILVLHDCLNTIGQMRL